MPDARVAPGDPRVDVADARLDGAIHTKADTLSRLQGTDRTMPDAIRGGVVPTMELHSGCFRSNFFAPHDSTLLRQADLRKREMHVVRTLRRIRDFVAHEATDVLHVHGTLLPRLDAQLVRLDEMATEQELAMRLQKAATRRQNVLAESLRSSYVVPLSRVAAELDSPDAPISSALRAPHKRIPRERLVRAAQSMADAADRFEPLVSEHLGHDFLRDMRATADALAQALVARNTPLRRHIVARATVERQLRNARQIVRLMDAFLEPEFMSSPARLAVWRRVKRYE